MSSRLLQPPRIVIVGLVLLLLVLGATGLAVVTATDLRPLPQDLTQLTEATHKSHYTDRWGKALNVTYQNAWNHTDQVPLHRVPELIQRAMVISEDKRFYSHGGVDWLARGAAIMQNIKALGGVRGASTLSEQVVRLIHRRPRTIWSKWLESFEAYQLEGLFSKQQILSFYLNQVPYGGQRRGIKQAASYYFDRDLDTLNEMEQLALVVLVRSPKWYDPVRQSQKLDRAITRLIDGLDLSDSQVKLLEIQTLEPVLANARGGGKRQNYAHVIAHLDSKGVAGQMPVKQAIVNTTLDAELQVYAQSILDRHLSRLERKQVGNGAVLVVEHGTNEIRTWTVGYAGAINSSEVNRPFSQIDSVLAKRQPGSTLKPLLYAATLEKGWTAATQLLDEPLTESVGVGLHRYHNYSDTYYGAVSVRTALGNSLNVPAVKAIQFVGVEFFLTYLHRLGINSLTKHPNVYGDGLALGNGEVSLFEMVQAYSTLARMGEFKALSIVAGESKSKRQTATINPEVSSIIADIISDKTARALEFGPESVLNLPYQTAVKTGTSSDYRDAWAIGFNDRYTVGVWMGNLDYKPMDQITGSKGPALVLRTIFSRLNQHRQVAPLSMSPLLISKRICIPSIEIKSLEIKSLERRSAEPNDQACEVIDELFVPGTETLAFTGQSETLPYRLRKPMPGLLLAMDPRIPDSSEYFEFQLSANAKSIKADWYVDGILIESNFDGRLSWKVSKGKHTVLVLLHLGPNDQIKTLKEVEFQVI